MTTTPVATREQIAADIAGLRAKAERLSRHDPRRDVIDAQVDALVDQWLDADG